VRSIQIEKGFAAQASSAVDDSDMGVTEKSEVTTDCGDLVVVVVFYLFAFNLCIFVARPWWFFVCLFILLWFFVVVLVRKVYIETNLGKSRILP
jgi:hypothetical protein